MEGGSLLPWLFIIIWIGWPLHSISADLRELRKMAEKNRR
jgi:hypothetical protein